MGRSYVSGRPVFETFIAKLPATLLLTGVSVGLTLLVSLPLGIFSAVNQNRWGDWVIRSLSFVGNSIPNFFAALLLLYIFAIQLQWLPVISRQLTVESVILPASTLALAMSAKYIRQVRATVLDELSKDYVLAARARGIPFADLQRSALIPGDDHYAFDALHRQSSRRHGHCGVDLHVGRRGQACGGRHQYARLSDDSGLCDVDGDHIRLRQSHDGSFLSVA